MDDVKDALMKGIDDFKACRSDVVFLCIIYPAVGLMFARFAFQGNMLPLLFPAVSGFALLGPAAAVGLYEMSRRREQSLDVNWECTSKMTKHNCPSLMRLSVPLCD